jgi:hypothetical protein
MISHSRFILLVAIATFASSAAARDSSGGEITLSGREGAALRLAVDDFLRHRYSSSGDLSRYTLKLRRSATKLEVDFIPDTDPRGPYPGGRTDYGPVVYYKVSLKPLKILSSLFGQ